MGRYLVVANQTLGGAKLEVVINERISRDSDAVDVFYVVVPTTAVEDESTAWMGGFPIGDESTFSGSRVRESVEAVQRRHEAEVDAAHQRAQQRFDRMLDKIRSAGGQAEGEVGVDDPVRATEDVLEVQADFDEIIVSTLPTTLSRWLKLDVPSRIARLTDTPVTTVEADEETGE